MSDITNQIKDFAGQVQKDPQGALQHGKEFLSEHGGQLKEQAQHYLGQGGKEAQNAGQQAQHGAGNAVDQAKNTFGLK